MKSLLPSHPTSGWPGADQGDPLASMIPCDRAPRPQDLISDCADCSDCGGCQEDPNTTSLLRGSWNPEPDLVEAGLDGFTGVGGIDAAGMVGEETSPRGHQPGADDRHETPAVPPAPGEQRTRPTVRLMDLEEGARRLAVVLHARALRAGGIGWEEIGRRLDMAYATVFKWVNRVRHLESPTAADLATRRAPGAKPRHGATPADTAALRANYLVTNRTADCGSAEEAARIALRKGQLSPALAQQLRGRDAAGRPLLPDSLRDQVIIHPAIVRSYRNPTEAGLDYISCPGTLKLVRDRITGSQRFARAGDILEMDDATINFPVCIPWDRAGLPGHPCADQWGVIVGRFQWLVCVDVGELYVPGWSYTARPRSSYRGEDVLATLMGVFRQHGVWERARFERGVFESKLVTTALERLNVELHTVHSPHTKAFIESLFSTMWTKLSDMPGQVGRFRGEMEEEAALIQSCKKGEKDPRRHFPMLAGAIEAFMRATGERNRQWVRSPNYGQWIPEQRWQLRRGEGRLRPLDPSSEWIFSPCVREWTVQGTLVGGTVPYFEGLSILYQFQEDWLYQFDGEKVQVFFDPFAPQCRATIVLVNSNRTVKAGTVLGTADQVNQVAHYARRVFGYGDEEDQGVAQAKRAAQALRREVRTILPGGKPGVQMTDLRDGEGRSVSIESGGAARPGGTSGPEAPSRARRPGIARTATPEQFRKQGERLSRLAAATAALTGE